MIFRLFYLSVGLILFIPTFNLLISPYVIYSRPHVFLQLWNTSIIIYLFCVCFISLIEKFIDVQIQYYSITHKHFCMAFLGIRELYNMKTVSLSQSRNISIYNLLCKSYLNFPIFPKLTFILDPGSSQYSHILFLICPAFGVFFFFFFNDIYFSEEFREFVLQNIPLSYCVYLFLHDWSQVKLFHMCVCVSRWVVSNSLWPHEL